MLLTRNRVSPCGAGLVARQVSKLIVDRLLDLLLGPIELAEVSAGSECRSMYGGVTGVNLSAGTVAQNSWR